jgi:hypothetical protein
MIGGSTPPGRKRPGDDEEKFAETRIERLIMALIGLAFCGILHVLATNTLNGLRE